MDNDRDVIAMLRPLIDACSDDEIEAMLRPDGLARECSKRVVLLLARCVAKRTCPSGSAQFSYCFGLDKKVDKGFSFSHVNANGRQQFGGITTERRKWPDCALLFVTRPGSRPLFVTMRGAGSVGGETLEVRILIRERYCVCETGMFKDGSGIREVNKTIRHPVSQTAWTYMKMVDFDVVRKRHREGAGCTFTLSCKVRFIAREEELKAKRRTRVSIGLPQC